MRCHVYKSRLQPDTYVYLKTAENFDCLPEALRNRLGPLEQALEFDLFSGRRLARVDADRLIEALDRNGYYLQLPPPRVPQSVRE